MTAADIEAVQRQIDDQAPKLKSLDHQLRKVVVGQQDMVSRLLIGLLTNGHILLEGVPGLAKTTAIKALAAALDTQFQRIQFTPDLLPADLLGTMIFMPAAGEFRTRKGPIFANFVLADEINRAPSKVQSALLEAMQEKQVTIGDETYPLPNLFLVMATQNPLEQEGTYPLPEAQVDRFMLKVRITYPDPVDEREVLDRSLGSVAESVEPALSSADVAAMQQIVQSIYVDEQVRDYILNLVRATRAPTQFGLSDLDRIIDFGASPRATICLGSAARAAAFLSGRGYVTPQDVKDVAHDVMRHRIILSYEAEAEEIDSEVALQRVLDSIPVP